MDTTAAPNWATTDKLRLCYDLRLALPTPSNNEIKEMHYKAYLRLRSSWRLLVLEALKGKRSGQPIPRAHLWLIRHSAGMLDWDNAMGGLKPLLDCLVVATTRNPSGLGLIANDNPDAMPYPPYLHQVKAPRKQGYTECRIYALD